MALGVAVLSAASEDHDEGDRIVKDGRGYYLRDGTSMAVPHVAGAAAVLRAAFPKASAGEIADALLGSATPMHANGEPTDAPSAAYGRGMLNLEAAVQWMGERTER